MKGRRATKTYRFSITVAFMSITLLSLLCSLSNPIGVLGSDGGELLSPYVDHEYLPGKPKQEAKLTQKQEIMMYIVEKFEDDANLAITMLTKCENHKLDPKATNHNRNGTVDRGVFQVNSIHGGEELYDYKKNIDAAHKIYVRAGKSFYPWSCAGVIGQKSYRDSL